MKAVAILLIMLVGVLSFAHATESASADQKTKAVIAQLRVGMTEQEVKFAMIPVSVDWGRVYYGGSGSGRLYFQVGKEEQIWVEIGSGLKFLAMQVSPVEKKKPWKREGGDAINVE